MPVPAIVGAALQGTIAPAWLFTVDGLNVAKEPVTAPRYGVLWGSVQLVLAPPGSSSSLVFDVDDPQLLLTFVEGMEVRLAKAGQLSRYDHNGIFTDVTDAPWFRGILEVPVAKLAGVGRVWTLRATGIDGIPDWCITEAPYTFAAGASLVPALQAIIALCGNRGELRAGADSASSTGQGPDKGIGALPASAIGGAANVSGAALTIPVGTSMRRALEQAWSVCQSPNGTLAGFRMTIDAYGCLRIWPAAIDGTYIAPDGDSATIVRAVAPGPYPADESFTRDGTSIIRQVIVTGAGGVSALVSDGSGKRGRSAAFTDQTLTTAAQCQSAGQAYLANHVVAVRGELGFMDSGASLYEGVSSLNRVQLTSDILGSTGARWEAGGWRVTFDHKTANPTIELTYGGRAPSAADLLRRQAGSPLIG